MNITDETKEIMRKMILQGREVAYIASWFNISRPSIRMVLLEDEISPNESDVEYKYYQQAKLIKEHVSDAYFYTDLAKILNISVSTVKLVCKMYNLKPCKKVFCEVCGVEIDTSNSKVMRKFCSRKCSDRNRRPLNEKSTVTKNCNICGKQFEGSSNSRYCSSDCKEVAKAVGGAIKCLTE